MESFYAYRVLLAESPYLQMKLFEDMEEQKTKEDYFRDIFEDIEEKNKVEFVDWGTDQIIFHIKRYGANIYLWQFGRRQEFTKPVISETSFSEISDTRYPYIFLIFDIKRQIVLIQRKTSIYQSMATVRGKLERFFIEKLRDYGITNVRISEITDKRAFWTKIKELDKIEEVEIFINPPNFFRGENGFDRATGDIHQETNYHKLKIWFENRFDGVTFDRQVFGEAVQRLSQGMGRLWARGFSNGFPRVVSSGRVPEEKSIDTNNMSESVLESEFNNLEEINKKDENE